MAAEAKLTISLDEIDAVKKVLRRGVRQLIVEHDGLPPGAAKQITARTIFTAKRWANRQFGDVFTDEHHIEEPPSVH